MNLDTVTEQISQRFHSARAPAIVARHPSSADPIIVSHIVSSGPTPQPTLAPPIDRAFAIHVHHEPLNFGETWIGGVHAKMPSIPTAGLNVFDLESSPTAFIREAFDFSRFYVKRSTLEDLAYSQGLPRFSDLQLPNWGHPDPVVHHLAQALISRQKLLGEERDSLFADWIALAFNTHILRAYGSSKSPALPNGGLAPNRFRYICDWMLDRLDRPLSIAEIAAELDMTPSHFARAFRITATLPPHKWMMRERVSRAKILLRAANLSLFDIAISCGFFDQSHFSKAFRLIEGMTPGQWRDLPNR